jgi:hypothetical protein
MAAGKACYTCIDYAGTRFDVYAPLNTSIEAIKLLAGEVHQTHIHDVVEENFKGTRITGGRKGVASMKGTF